MKGGILKVLRGSGDYVSGEVLSKELGISRVSIWKHIRSLKEDGYIIEASSKGYRLVSSPDLLLPCEFPDWEGKIHYFREIASTMDVARELAKRGAEAGTIVVAESQSRGRGRLRREWLSPKGGIYFTVILRPEISPIYAPMINLMASVAVASAIRRLLGLRAELKWPNDVLIQGRKVCGILAEMDAEVDAVNFVNVGIGINANSFISQFGATSLKSELGKEISRKEIFRSVVEEILRGVYPEQDSSVAEPVLSGEILPLHGVYPEQDSSVASLPQNDTRRRVQQQALLGKADLLEEWKSLSATLNKEVRIVSLGEEIVGQAIDIDANGALIVKGEDGSLRTVIAGDCIHLR